MVGKKHNLDRGIKGSKAKHQSIAQYYKKINSSLDGITFTIDDFKPKKFSFWTQENKAGVLQRLNAETASLRMKALERDEYKNSFDLSIQKQKEMQKDLESKEYIIQRTFKNLTTDQKNSLVKKGDELRQLNYEQEKIRQAENEKRWAEERRQRIELEMIKKGSRRR